MSVTMEEAEALLHRVRSVLASQELPTLRDVGLCYMLRRVTPPLLCDNVYHIVSSVFNHEIPYYRDSDCPPEWQRGVWSEERMTLLCMLGALSAEDIVEMCK